MQTRPKFIDSPYFVGEYGNWHLKPGAPPEVVAEFNAYMGMEELEKAVKKDKLPEGGVWRTIKGHKVYIKDGEILAGHVPGVTDKADFKKLVKKPATKAEPAKKAPAKKTAKATEAPAKTEPAKKPATKKASTASEGYTVTMHGVTGDKKTQHSTKAEADKHAENIRQLGWEATVEKNGTKKAKAEADAKKARKEIDALAGNNAKAEAKVKKKTVEEAQAESKKATDEALKKPNPKAKQGKGATKEDLKKLEQDNAEAKKKEVKGKGATKEDLDSLPKNEKPKRKPVTKEDLDDMFGLPKDNKATRSKKTELKPKKEDVAVIRTEKQANNEIAYDVGDKIGGARKDTARIQEAVSKLISRQSGQSLEELEAISPETAQKYCIKKNLLPQMDDNYWANEFKSGTDINVAVLKASVYDRIAPKPAGDTPKDRAEYMNAIRSLQRVLEPIKDWDTFKKTIYEMRDTISNQDPKRMKSTEDSIAYSKQKLANPNPSEADRQGWDRNTGKMYTRSIEEYRQWHSDRIKKMEADLAKAKKGVAYSPLGEKLTNFFTSSDSANATINRIFAQKLTWDKYTNDRLQKQKDAKDNAKKGITNKEKWERVMPSVIKRSGGRTSKVEKPEDMVKAFGMRGVEFGNWVDDSSGTFHMKKCAEAFMDLADIIGISDKDVSFNGKLAMAFGARGKGWALAHYEPDSKVINITKEGGAGTLAHEWGHALDNILYQESVGHTSLNLGADGLGDKGNPEIKAIYKDLMHAILIGDGLGTEMVPNKHKEFYSYHPSFKQAVQNYGLNGAIKVLTGRINAEHDRRKEFYEDYIKTHPGSTYASANLEKVEKKRKADLSSMVQEVAYHHEKLTGEKLEEIPAFTGRSQYYCDSARQAKSSGYWTSNVEMFARAFENYIEGKMQTGKVKNDYLVHGTYEKGGSVMPAPYPQDAEREAIHKQFDRLMEAVRKSGAIQKGLAVEIMTDMFYNNLKAELAKPEEYVDQRARNAYNVANPSEVIYIPVNRLNCPYQTEEALNFDKIRENVERMKSGEHLEPVVIGYNYDVHDGHHRIEASKIMNYTHVPCIVGGSNDLDVQRAVEEYRSVWKSLSKSFNEADHPRDDLGKFVSLYHWTSDPNFKYDPNFKNTKQEMGAGLYATHLDDAMYWHKALQDNKGNRPPYAIPIDASEAKLIYHKDIPYDDRALAKHLIKHYGGSKPAMQAVDKEEEDITGDTFGAETFKIAQQRLWAKSQGYDGIVMHDDREGNQVVFFNADKLKFGSAVTEDDVYTAKRKQDFPFLYGR